MLLIFAQIYQYFDLPVSRLKISRYWLFFIAALVLLMLGWCNWLLISQPYTGFTWSYTSGVIISVDSQGPAAGQLQVGEKIIAIDGGAVFEARSLPGRQIGDVVSFIVDRQGKPITVAIQLVRIPFIELAKRLSIIPVAFAFWLLGVTVLAYGQAEKLVHLFFLFCQATSALLGLGSVSSFAPLSGWWAFGLLLWWIGPLTFHTHLALAAPSRFRLGRNALAGIYSSAFLLSLLDFHRLRLSIAGPLLAFKYLWVGVFMLASASILVAVSLWGPSAENRRRTRIAGISALTAFMPFVLLSLIPDAIAGRYILRYEVTLLALLILPLGYSYSILSYRLVKIEREISQAAAYALAVFIVAIFYAFIYAFFSGAFLFKDSWFSPVEAIVIVLIALTAPPVHQRLYRWVYLVFYGSWVDDGEAVKRISKDLKYVKGDTYSIAQTLCQTLQKTMLLDYVHLLLSDGKLIKSAKAQAMGNEIHALSRLGGADLFNQLQERTGHEVGSGEELREFFTAMGIEIGSLLGPKPQLWLLFGGLRNWQGLLVLSAKRGRGDYDAKDLEILEVVLRQAGAALENERLLEEVRQRSEQIRELNRKSRWTIEVERKRIARDLHDMVIQTLVGINFQLATIRAKEAPESQDELDSIRNNLHECLVELRGICADLRPPALDALGLVPALEARITEIRSQVPFEIYLKFADLSAYEIRDEVALCVYRFLQEALVNVLKHSNATLVMINLDVVRNHWLRLSIEDDGQGANLPKTLEELAVDQHYGLVGLQEQVEAVGGAMTIETEKGKGFRLIAWMLLKQGQDSFYADLIKMDSETLK